MAAQSLRPFAIFCAVTIVAAGIGIVLDRSSQRQERFGGISGLRYPISTRDGPPLPFTRPFAVSEVDRAPQLLPGSEPTYPATRQTRIEGTVDLNVIVDSTGRVQPGAVTTISSPDPELERAAVLYVLGMRFRPGLRRGQPVPVLMHYELKYAAGRGRLVGPGW